MAYSTQQVVSDGTLANLALSVVYFDRSEITVSFDGVDVPSTSGLWAWVGLADKIIHFTPNVPNGTAVLIRRKTDVSDSRHVFSTGAQFLEQTLDENFTQILRVAQEVQEGTTIKEVFTDVDMHNNQLVNLGAPTLPGHAVNLATFDAGMVAVLAAQQSATASAASASTSATAANTSKVNAGQSADSATASAAAAQTSATNAGATQSAINDRYYGARTTDPTTRPSGAAIQVGDEYFYTGSGPHLLKRWDGTWQASDINTANFAAPGGSSLSGHQPTGAGLGATTVQAELWRHEQTLGSVVAAAYFGIVPGIGVDNTAGFAALANYFRNLTNNVRLIVLFPPGLFFTDSFEIPAPTAANVNGSFDLRGAGSDETCILPRTTSATSSVFGSVTCSFTRGFKLSGMTIQGNSANPLQDGIAFYANTTPGESHGGLTDGAFEDFNIWGFTGRQSWMRGGGQDDQHPIQFISFKGVAIDRLAGNHFPCLEVMGQFGQIQMFAQFNGRDPNNNGGPNVILSTDYRHQQLFPLSYDTADHYLTNTNTGFLTQATCMYPAMSPLRFVGASLPTTSPQVALGTTYYMSKYGLTGVGAVDTKFRLHTSRANAAAGTPITCSNQGTPANYSLVGLWADSIASNTFTTNEPHRLIIGDMLTVVGVNLPTGLALTTNYYVIRVSHYSFKLASSYANAHAGVALAVSGGTLANFGFLPNGGAQAGLRSPYSVVAMPLTLQAAETGIYLQTCNDAVLNIHSESLKRVVESVGANSCNTLIGGYYGFNSATDGGAGALGCFSGGGTSRTKVTGAPHTNGGSVDTYYYAYNSATVHVDPESFSQRISYAATITPLAVSCHSDVGTLTGNMTVNAPAVIPPNGSDITFDFTSDGSARTITWGSVYKNASLTGASAANQRAKVAFKSDGTNLVQITSTGWY